MPPEERLIGLTLALEEALGREAWDEADGLFAARDAVFAALKPPYGVPREVDEIDARILARLQHGQAEIRRETMSLTTNRRVAAAYGGGAGRGSVRSAA